MRSLNLITYLSCHDEEPASHEANFPVVKGADDVDDAEGISRAVPKGGTCIREDGNEHVLLHVEWTRVQRELPLPEPGDPKPFCGKHAGHEAPNGKRRNLNRNHGDG